MKPELLERISSSLEDLRRKVNSMVIKNRQSGLPTREQTDAILVLDSVNRLAGYIEELKKQS